MKRDRYEPLLSAKDLKHVKRSHDSVNVIRQAKRIFSRGFDTLLDIIISICYRIPLYSVIKGFQVYEAGEGSRRLTVGLVVPLVACLAALPCLYLTTLASSPALCLLAAVGIGFGVLTLMSISLRMLDYSKEQLQPESREVPEAREIAIHQKTTPRFLSCTSLLMAQNKKLTTQRNPEPANVFTGGSTNGNDVSNSRHTMFGTSKLNNYSQTDEHKHFPNETSIRLTH